MSCSLPKFETHYITCTLPNGTPVMFRCNSKKQTMMTFDDGASWSCGTFYKGEPSTAGEHIDQLVQSLQASAISYPAMLLLGIAIGTLAHRLRRR